MLLSAKNCFASLPEDRTAVIENKCPMQICRSGKLASVNQLNFHEYF